MVLYMETVKAIYGLLVSIMLFYQKLTADHTDNDFEINPYNPCMTNKQVKGIQMAFSWHVGDLYVCHVNSKTLNKLIEWMKITKKPTQK